MSPIRLTSPALRGVALFPVSAVALLALTGCPDNYGNGTANGNGGFKETGLVDTADTGDTGETGDTAETGDTGDTGDTDTGDTADTGTKPTLAALAAWPRNMVVDVGATYTIRAVATETDGSRHVYAGAKFHEDDSAVATVDGGGVVTAVGAGSTVIRVTAEGQEADLNITVNADFSALVTVVDATTGAGISGATVRVPAGDFTTDASGVATVTLTDGLPVTYTAWITDDHYAVSVLDTVSRQLTIPLEVVADQSPSATLHGSVDFTDVKDAGFGEVVFGLAAASVQGDLALFQVEDLLADNRTLSLFNTNVSVPENIFLESYQPDYYAPAFSGSTSVWCLGGPVGLGELQSGISGIGDALALIVDHLPDMSWGSTTGLATSAGATTEAPLAPAVAFSDSSHVALPSLSAGFDGTEDQFVVTADGVPGEGWSITGLGLGSGVIDVSRVPAGNVSGASESMVYTLAEVGGLGSGGGRAAAVAMDDGGTVTFPDLQDIPVVNAWSPGTRELDVSVDSDAALVRIQMVDDSGRVHELWTDGGWVGTVDKSLSDFQRGKADVTVESYTVLDGNFEEWVSTSGLDVQAREPDTVSRVTQVE